MIELHHPVHGTKHAYLESEAAADEKNGWVRAGMVQPTIVPRDPYFAEHLSEPRVDMEALSKLYEAKFGKKPHHRMKAETIAEKLK